jgi:hypothetical protein
VDGQLGFQLGDASAGGDELGVVTGGQPGFLAGVDAVLALPGGGIV